MVTEQKAPDMVPLDAAARERVEQQVGQYIDSLVSADMQSDEFKSRLDSAFRLGKEEVSNAASLMTGRFMERNMVGMESSPAFKAIHEMRGHLDQLNPGADGDLLAPNRLLGIIPWGNKLQAYFRKYQSAGAQIRDALEKVNLARDDMQKDATEIEHVKGKLWEAMLKLSGAIHFSEQLDGKLATRVAELKATDPIRARDDERLHPHRHHRHVGTGHRADGRARHRQPGAGDGDAAGGQGLDREPGGGHRDAARHPCAEDRRIRSQLADLLEQLTLLDASLRRIAEDALRDDAEALVVHGKFLQERFGPVTFVGDTVPQALPGERS